jgi:hypothetical protein
LYQSLLLQCLKSWSNEIESAEKAQGIIRKQCSIHGMPTSGSPPMQITVTINLQGGGLGAPVPAVFQSYSALFHCALMSIFVRKSWRNWSNKYKFSSRDQQYRQQYYSGQRLLHSLILIIRDW